MIVFALCGKPHGMDYGSSTPWPEGGRSYFANDIGSPIDVGVDPPSVRRPEQAPLHPLPQIVFLVTERFVIQKAALAGIALFRHPHRDAAEFGLVCQHVDEAGMRDLHKGLVGALAEVD